MKKELEISIQQKTKQQGHLNSIKEVKYLVELSQITLKILYVNIFKAFPESTVTFVAKVQTKSAFKKI